MSNKNDYLFWKIAEAFIVEAGYRIVKLFPNQQELWLEKKEHRNAPIIRILRYNLDWSNWMKRDIELTASTAEKIRKQMQKRKLSVVNIYVSEQTPVDDFTNMIREPYILHTRLSETAVHSILFTEGMYPEAQQKLLDLAGTSVIGFDSQSEYSSEEIEAIKTRTLQHARDKINQEQALFQAGKPFFTYVFMIAQVVIFLLMELYGGSTNPSTLLHFGAKFNPLILQGEWWRFFTPIFLHIGFLHLAMNTLGLYFVGTAAERIFGSFRFLFVYLFAGFGGSLASFLFSHDLSAGASGAIFGLLGALLYFGIIYPGLFLRTMGPTIFFIIIFNLAFGFSVSMVDNAGHLGGLAGGFLAAGIVHFPKKKKPILQLAFSLVSIIIIAGTLRYGYNSELGAKDEQSLMLLAEEYLEQEEYDKAYTILSEFETENKVTEKTYFLLSYTEIKKGMLTEAKAHLLEAIKLDNSFHEAHYNLALIYLENGEIEKAREHAAKAVELNPNQKDYQSLLKEL